MKLIVGLLSRWKSSKSRIKVSLSSIICLFIYDLSWIRADIFVILFHDDVIKWKHFPRNWLFVRGIHRSPVTAP